VNARPAIAAALAACLACGIGPAAAQGGDYFRLVDLDHDARISLAEYVERFSWAFRQMDRNRDGVLDPGEQLVANAPRLTYAEHAARLEAQFPKPDSNHDGGLSRREFLAPPAR
jgi:Ca2+-binding EF-hand superfamily protein